MAIHPTNEENVLEIAHVIHVETLRCLLICSRRQNTLDIVVLVEHFVLLNYQVVHDVLGHELADVANVLLVVGYSRFLSLLVFHDAIGVKDQH